MVPTRSYVVPVKVTQIVALGDMVPRRMLTNMTQSALHAFKMARQFSSPFVYPTYQTERSGGILPSRKRSEGEVVLAFSDGKRVLIIGVRGIAFDRMEQWEIVFHCCSTLHIWPDSAEQLWKDRQPTRVLLDRLQRVLDLSEAALHALLEVAEQDGAEVKTFDLPVRMSRPSVVG